MPEPISTATQVLGERIKNRRTTLGINQETLAHRAGLHWTFVDQLDRGQRANGLHLDPSERAHGLMPPSGQTNGLAPSESGGPSKIAAMKSWNVVPASMNRSSMLPRQRGWRSWSIEANRQVGGEVRPTEYMSLNLPKESRQTIYSVYMRKRRAMWRRGAAEIRCARDPMPPRPGQPTLDGWCLACRTATPQQARPTPFVTNYCRCQRAPQ